MKNVIATWICIDKKENATHFPSAKGSSADVNVQQVYWRCICTFFFAARYHNPDAELVLFSNQACLPEIEKASVKDILQNLKVSFFVTPFEYVTPAGYYGEWRNQFYEFSIFKFVCGSNFFNNDDNFLLLDSDCIITGNLSLLFKAVQKNEVLTYQIDYETDHRINGISRKDMRFIFQELSHGNLYDCPAYYGGEFYASTVNFMCKIMDDFYVLWPQLLNRNLMGLKKLNEEAHVLSYLFYKKGISGGHANSFIKRLWTDPSTYRNVEVNDASLLIWHLPAEKTTGFRHFFKWLKLVNFNPANVNPQKFPRRIQEIFMVPEIPVQQRPYYATKKFLKRYLGKIKTVL